ncbi:hypothetical protein GCM10022377_10230 [Zhihengliuella alba]|uniref:Uncharacterized protein n=1 Tax=Zhihengliuella alba TaxID=547018 RepID=A0ABP7D6W8_9MICC
MGISHRRFRGWMPAEGESEWSDMEQDKMLALSTYEALLCPKCGGPLGECTDPKNQGRYAVEPPTRCHRMTAHIREVDQWEKQGRKETGALMLRSRLLTDPPIPRRQSS